MKIDAFAMERLQSTWENRVAWNLSESGVHPLTLDELVDSEEMRAALFAQSLGYPQTNGTIELRTLISAMYPGATVDHVEVTNGGSEANCVSVWHLLERGDEAVLMVPNYMQAGALARALGATVRPWPLAQDGEPGSGTERWRPDVDRLADLVTDRTKLILICNPNNPTGARMTADEIDRTCAIASRSGAWVLSDEIYRGAELDGRETPTIWGRYERALVTSGLSKAYGLPGLRIGWIVGPPAVVEALWGVHDYTTIAPGAVNDRLARFALEPARRERILARTRGIIRTNYPIVGKWIAQRHPAMRHVPPEAGAIVFIRFFHAIHSTALIERLRDEQSVLVVPGDHFEMDGYVRIGFGSETTHLAGGLERIGRVLDAIPIAAGPESRGA